MARKPFNPIFPTKIFAYDEQARKLLPETGRTKRAPVQAAKARGAGVRGHVSAWRASRCPKDTFVSGTAAPLRFQGWGLTTLGSK